MKKQSDKRYFRTYERVENDVIMPYLGLGCQPGTEVRMYAIMEVLRRLPDTDYRKLIKKHDNNEFQWFILHYDLLGRIHPFPANIFNEKSEVFKERQMAPYAKVIILSPILEEEDFDIAVAVVAHELAHIILEHKIHFLDPTTNEAQEKSAWNKIKEWGFKKEEKKHNNRIKNKLLTLDLKEIAQTLQISTHTIMRYIKAGKLRASKISEWKIKQSDLEKFLKENINIKSRPKKK